MTPDGKPETVYELCEEVCEAIAAKPMNYHQGYWFESVENIQHGCDIAPSNREACGTAYCRAGWMSALARGPEAHLKAGSIEIYDWARNLLTKAGVPLREIDELFDGAACGDREWGSEDYVAQGIRGMQEFMDNYEDKLKATKIQD